MYGYMYSYSNTVDLRYGCSVRPDSTRSYVSELKTEDQRTAQDRGSCAYVLVNKCRRPFPSLMSKNVTRNLLNLIPPAKSFNVRSLDL